MFYQLRVTNGGVSHATDLDISLIPNNLTLLWAVSDHCTTVDCNLTQLDRFDDENLTLAYVINAPGLFDLTATGGSNNSASGVWSSISGGSHNQANGSSSSISGGLNNIAHSGHISGGRGNQTYASSTSISGGQDNIARGSASHISGGCNNVIPGAAHWSTVSGGSTRTTSGFDDWVAGSLFEDN